MGSRLIKLEEAKFKKPDPHVEVLNDEEVEDLDERDKADYERNKQFENLIAETIAMREKMEKMQPPFTRPKGWMIISMTWGA